MTVGASKTAAAVAIGDFILTAKGAFAKVATVTKRGAFITFGTDAGPVCLLHDAHVAVGTL